MQKTHALEYSSDWVSVCGEGGAERLYLVHETKATRNSDNPESQPPRPAHARTGT
jgi:hypothetical protein